MIVSVRQAARYINSQATATGLRGELIRGVAGSFTIRLLGLALAFANVVVLARVLGAHDYGIYAYALSLVGLLAVPTELGLPQLVTRQIALYHVNEQWGLVRGLLQCANQAVFALSLSMLIACASVAYFFSDRFDPVSLHTFLLALCSLPLLALGVLRLGALRGMKHTTLSLLPESILRPALGLVLVLALAAMWGADQVGPAHAMEVYLFSTFIGFLVGSVMLYLKLPAPASEAKPIYESKSWLRSAIPFMFLASMLIVSSRTDIVMLGMFRSAEEVGLYRGAFQLATLVAFPLQAMNYVLAPHFARLWVQSEFKRLQRIVTISARAVFAISLPLAILFICAGNPIMGGLFGEEFASGGVALAILCFGQLLNAGMGAVGSLLNMTGLERRSAEAVAVAAIANVLLNLWLIPVWGINGASLATTISLFVWNLYMGFFVVKKLKIDPTALGGIKWTKCSAKN